MATGGLICPQNQPHDATRSRIEAFGDFQRRLGGGSLDLLRSVQHGMEHLQSKDAQLEIEAG